MKAFFALLICVFAFAQPKKVDTLQISSDIQKATQSFEAEVQKEKELDEKISAAKSKIKYMDSKIDKLFKSLKENYNTPYQLDLIESNKMTIREDFEMLYCEDYNSVEVEIVERSWIGKIFHKLPFKFKKYKIVNGEKLYLD